MLKTPEIPEFPLVSKIIFFYRINKNYMIQAIQLVEAGTQTKTIISQQSKQISFKILHLNKGQR